MSHFSDRLTKIRMERKKENSSWTQGYVAEKIGVARVTYTGYERGTKTPPLETVILISKLFDVSTDYFLADLPISEKSLFGEGIKEQASAYGKDSGMAFYGGGRDWTEEEIEIADALIQKLREQKEAKAKNDQKKK